MGHRPKKRALRAAIGGAAAAAALAIGGVVAVAQDGAAPAPEASAGGPYEGVAPGTSNTPPRHAAVRRNEARGEAKAILSWVGFEALPSGGSRFFLQTSRSVPYTTVASDGQFVVVLPSSRVHLRNTRRPIDTRFFNTPVRSARVERRGRNDLAVVFSLRAAATPTLSTAEGANGYHFVYVDFPAGNYAPAAGPVPVPEGPAPGQGGAPAHREGTFETEEPGYDPEEPPQTNIRVYQGGD